MKFNSLLSISPIDGRYRNKVNVLENYFSEYALIKYRVEVEIKYLIEFTKVLSIPDFFISEIDTALLHEMYQKFSPEDALRVKEIEKTTNHDVKAVEYFIKEKVKLQGIKINTEFIHFGLTSQDINNTAIPLSIKRYKEEIFDKELVELCNMLHNFALQWKNIPMLAKTHGQPASPTTLGKEFMVFVDRLRIQIQQLDQIPHSAKFGGATGNFNAHKIAYPAVNWIKFGNQFASSLGLSRSRYTTQIEHYDNLAALFDNSKRINTILMDLARDIWAYISMEYFKQKIKAGEIGSSAMPHKVNPIDFENAEGNLGIANALFEHMAAKLPISRLQRDLTDSTVLRNIGVPFAHTSIAIQSMMKGLDKLLLNPQKIDEDLENNWAVIAEAIQTILRREQVENPYEKLKELTRKNEKVTQSALENFIDTMDIPEAIKKELKTISPFNYVGYTIDENESA
jgi:adenylosuccinate lyase